MCHICGELANFYNEDYGKILLHGLKLGEEDKLRGEFDLLKEIPTLEPRPNGE